MTALVSLLFIAMIPIDCKITIFFLTGLLMFLVTIILLVNSQLLFQKKEGL